MGHYGTDLPPIISTCEVVSRGWIGCPAASCKQIAKNQTGKLVMTKTRLKDTHLTKQGLKDRNGTARLIGKFPGPPDKTSANMYRSSGPPVCWYEKGRVQDAESSPEFIEAQQERAGRRAGAKRSVATKKERMRQYLD